MRDRDVNRDYPRVCRPSDHRKRLWDRAGEIVADPFQILYQKNYALCGNCGVRGGRQRHFARPRQPEVEWLGGISENGPKRRFAASRRHVRSWG